MTQRRASSKSVSSTRSVGSRTSKGSDSPSAVLALGAFVDGIYRADLDKFAEARDLAWEAMNEDSLPHGYEAHNSDEDRDASLDGLEYSDSESDGEHNLRGEQGYPGYNRPTTRSKPMDKKESDRGLRRKTLSIRSKFARSFRNEKLQKGVSFEDDNDAHGTKEKALRKKLPKKYLSSKQERRTTARDLQPNLSFASTIATTNSMTEEDNMKEFHFARAWNADSAIDQSQGLGRSKRTIKKGRQETRTERPDQKKFERKPHQFEQRPCRRDDCSTHEDDAEQRDVREIKRKLSTPDFPNAVYAFGAVVNHLTDAAGFGLDALHDDSDSEDEYGTSEGGTSSGEEFSSDGEEAYEARISRNRGQSSRKQSARRQQTRKQVSKKNSIKPPSKPISRADSVMSRESNLMKQQMDLLQMQADVIDRLLEQEQKEEAEKSTKLRMPKLGLSKMMRKSKKTEATGNALESQGNTISDDASHTSRASNTSNASSVEMARELRDKVELLLKAGQTPTKASRTSTTSKKGKLHKEGQRPPRPPRATSKRQAKIAVTHQNSKAVNPSESSKPGVGKIITSTPRKSTVARSPNVAPNVSETVDVDSPNDRRESTEAKRSWKKKLFKKKSSARINASQDTKASKQGDSKDIVSREQARSISKQTITNIQGRDNRATKTSSFINTKSKQKQLSPQTDDTWFLAPFENLTGVPFNLFGNFSSPGENEQEREDNPARDERSPDTRDGPSTAKKNIVTSPYDDDDDSLLDGIELEDEGSPKDLRNSSPLSGTAITTTKRDHPVQPRYSNTDDFESAEIELCLSVVESPEIELCLSDDCSFIKDTQVSSFAAEQISTHRSF